MPNSATGASYFNSFYALLYFPYPYGSGFLYYETIEQSDIIYLNLLITLHTNITATPHKIKPMGIPNSTKNAIDTTTSVVITF